MSTTLNDWLGSQQDGGRLFAEERLIVATAESIWVQMEDRNVTKAELASALGKSKAYVTQVLSGGRNMTLRTLADIAFALGVQVEVRLRPAAISSEWAYREAPHGATRAETAFFELADDHSAANEWLSGSIVTPAGLAEAA